MLFFVTHICRYHIQNLEGDQALHRSPAFISALFLGLHTKPVTNSSLLFPLNHITMNPLSSSDVIHLTHLLQKALL